ncbi:unnamed protein product [Musa textilis]
MCLMFWVLTISLETCFSDLYEKHEHTLMEDQSHKNGKYAIMMFFTLYMFVLDGFIRSHFRS